MSTAIVYSSMLGGTRRAAEYIGSKIGADVINVKDAGDISKYDRIIIGSGVYAGRVPKSIVKLVKGSNHPNVYLFLSCLYNGEKGTAQLKKVSEDLDVKDAVFFNKIKKQIGVEGSELDEYATRLSHN
ncbi:MAG: hypothetical protein MJY54_02480 [archaeon]|nr:hypothetical protein [archaeon]